MQCCACEHGSGRGRCRGEACRGETKREGVRGGERSAGCFGWFGRNSWLVGLVGFVGWLVDWWGWLVCLA